MRYACLGTATACLSLFTVMLADVAKAQAATISDAPLTACSPDKGPIGAVKPCGKIWKLGSGQASIGNDGTVRVNLHGLVLNDVSVGNANGSPDGVDAVAVAVSCNSGSDSAPTAQTEPVALSHTGDATIDAKLSLPRDCSTPRVLVRERYEGKIGGWLAATGP